MIQTSLLCALMHLLLTCVTCALFACQSEENSSREAINLSRDQLPLTAVNLAQTKEQTRPRWLFIGDSLTAGFGVEPELNFVSRLQDRLNRESWVDRETGEIPILKNAGVSGDTSAGTLRRIDWLLSDETERVFLCIGANDGMRGQPLEALKNNLIEITHRIRKRGTKLHLMKMLLPPNYGLEYTRDFAKTYEEVSQSEGLTLFPFLLRGVAGVNRLNQADGIHPNAEGHRITADQLLEHLVTIGLLVKRSESLQ